MPSVPLCPLYRQPSIVSVHLGTTGESHVAARTDRGLDDSLLPSDEREAPCNRQQQAGTPVTRTPALRSSFFQAVVISRMISGAPLLAGFAHFHSCGSPTGLWPCGPLLCLSVPCALSGCTSLVCSPTGDCSSLLLSNLKIAKADR